MNLRHYSEITIANLSQITTSLNCVSYTSSPLWYSVNRDLHLSPYFGDLDLWLVIHTGRQFCDWFACCCFFSSWWTRCLRERKRLKVYFGNIFECVSYWKCWGREGGIFVLSFHVVPFITILLVGFKFWRKKFVSWIRSTVALIFSFIYLSFFLTITTPCVITVLMMLRIWM